ncbi:MFS transporter [Actinokineospora bangkokensis]|uniref:MFS transporter n=1 Tax=Actinokineospora bangkokensis TaxID=1193682 RepID=A0A1Q9LJ34_9PSEU|nr:MFS transporter [Actinokineospora bangkokensis]OLR91989.1 MFS transporter [Actinokineospora bangkokensis]
MGVMVDLRPLRASRAFRALWVGRSFSAFGSQLTLVAVMYQVWRDTGSTVWTGAVGLAQGLPMVFLGPFAGALVDRVDRRRFYLWTLVGQAACAVLLVVQAVLGAPIGVVLVIVAVQACFIAGGGPAARTFLPRLLPPEQLAAGLALQRITGQVAMLAGPAVGGVLIGFTGVVGCYALDAASFSAAFLGAFGLPAMLPGGEPARAGLGGVLDGLRFLVGHATVRGALVTDLAATVLSMPVSLFPLVNAERFGDDPRTLGLFLSAVAVGGVVASALSGTFTSLPRQGVVMLVGSLSWGVALLLFGLVANPWAGLALLVVAGAADTASVVSRNAIVQLNTPDELMGRVGAAELAVGFAGPEVGNMRAGLVASATSGTTALVSGGALCVAAVLAVAACTPGLRKHVHEPVHPAAR